MIMIVTREPSKTAKMFPCFKSRNQIDLNSKFQKGKRTYASDPGSLWSQHSCYFSWAFLHPRAYISTNRLIELIGSMTTMDDNLQLFHPIEKKQPRLKKKPPVFFKKSSFFVCWTKKLLFPKLWNIAEKFQWLPGAAEHLNTTCGFASLSPLVKGAKQICLIKSKGYKAGLRALVERFKLFNL